MDIDIKNNNRIVIMLVPHCTHHLHTTQDLAKIGSFLKVIAEPNRLRILCLLQQGELSVGEIQEKSGLPMNLVSFHLRALKKATLLKSKKESLNVFYSLENANISNFKDLLDTFICEECRKENLSRSKP